MKRRTDTMRVMIISHDRATIRALKIALGKKTEDISEIASAYSREQILSLTKREEFDLLICDADMPGEEGVEALRELRQKKYRGGIILISSQCSQKMTREALRLEAGDFLLKPVEAAELWEAARGVIKRYKEKQEEELKRSCSGRMSAWEGSETIRKPSAGRLRDATSAWTRTRAAAWYLLQ